MKNYFFVLLLLISAKAGSQVLWSTAMTGGGDKDGSIFRINTSGQNFSHAYQFPVTTVPYINTEYSSPIEIPGGRIFCTSGSGGLAGGGTIFSYNPLIGGVFTTHYYFNSEGRQPGGSLMRASNGKLYGTTYSGGAHEGGVLYSFDPAGNIYTKLHDFNAASGHLPKSGLVQAANGKLYGMTTLGGASGGGVIYSFDINTSTYTKLADLNATTGSVAYGDFTEGPGGKLFAVTYTGGSNGTGTIISFDPVSNQLVKRYDFNATSGGNSQARLLAIGQLLYGVTTTGGLSGGGTLFNFNETTSVVTVHWNFSYGTGAASPQGGLVLASNNTMYGTFSQGSGNAGGLFQYNADLNQFSFIVSFNYTLHGAQPQTSLVQSSNGNLYGFTSKGGANDAGTLIRYIISTGSFSKLYDFYERSQGASPEYGMIKGNDNLFYGVGFDGGTADRGVIFRFDPATSAYTRLFSFTTENSPSGRLCQAANGLFYGVTSGVKSGFGTLYSFDPNMQAYATLHTFTDSPDGAVPRGGVIQAANGKLYGMTSQGGASGFGVIYSYDIGLNIYTKIADLATGSSGKAPYGSFVQASNGLLYGLTSDGGLFNRGTVITLNTATHAVTKIHDFQLPGPGSPFGSLIVATDGYLYGVTDKGGAGDQGAVFRIDPSNNSLTLLSSFGVLGLQRPQGSLFQSADGDFYGMARHGGSHSKGGIFRYPLAGGPIQHIFSFSNSTVSDPKYASFIETPPSLTFTMPTVSCRGSAVLVQYTTSYNHQPGNVFEVQLSNSAGSFANPVIIGSIASTNASGNITGFIPDTVPLSAGYKVRLVSTLPAVISNIRNLSILNAANSIKETMGTESSASIEAHELNNFFDNDDLTMYSENGLNVIVDNSPAQESNGYTGASGGSNISVGQVLNAAFVISGINTSAFTNMTLSFAVYKSANNSNGSNVQVGVSTDGVNYTSLSFAALPTGSNTIGWYFRTATGVIPATSNLRIRFRHATGSNGHFRIDDVKLAFSAPSSVTADGPLNACPPQTVTLSASPSASYEWSNGAVTKSIVVDTPGNYYCIMSTDNGCLIKSQDFIVAGCSITLNLGLYIEGMISGGQLMPVIDPVNHPDLCDTVMVSLHDMQAPYAIAHTVKALLKTDGSIVVPCPPNALNNTYYISIRHRNALEVWSREPVSFSGLNTDFDFRD